MKSITPYSSASYPPLSFKPPIEEQVQSANTGMTHMPQEIHCHIFSYLDIPDLLLTRIVSKKFRDIASDTYLWHPISISLGLDAQEFGETRKAIIAFMKKAKGIASVTNSKEHTEIITHQKKWTLDNINKLDAWVIRLEIDKINPLPKWIQNRLKEWPTLENTKDLKQGVFAHCTLVTWIKIAKAISLPTSDLENLCSIEDAVNKVTYFSGWLKENNIALSQLTVFDLTFKGLKVVPKEIGHFLQLIGLNLSHNQIQKIPKELGECSQLTHLYLSCNQLKELPKEVGNLSKLTRLHLSHNQLKKLPKEVGNLSKLTSLFLSQNQLQVIPKEIGNLRQLTVLDLSNNELQEIPKEIKELLQLKDLVLSQNPLNRPSCLML